MLRLLEKLRMNPQKFTLFFTQVSTSIGLESPQTFNFIGLV